VGRITLEPAGSGAKISGEFHLEAGSGQRGVKGTLQGELSFGEKAELSRFSLLALGDTWGEGENTRGARPGKQPMGWSFNLVANPGPADRIAPQFSHWLRGYWEPGS
jgi:hypothetical protein